MNETLEVRSAISLLQSLGYIVQRRDPRGHFVAVPRSTMGEQDRDSCEPYQRAQPWWKRFALWGP